MTFALFDVDPREAAIEQLHRATAIYTHDPVVDGLLDHMRWPSQQHSLVDSSCGDGAFLRRALKRLLDYHPAISPAALVERITGWEIHPVAAELARHNLAADLVDHGWDQRTATDTARMIVRCADFLTQGPRAPTFDTIVGNPPYVRWLHIPPLLRKEYEQEVPAYAQADLLHSFLARCAEVLKPGGELAMVVSDRWLFNASAAKLREAVGRVFRMTHVERLDAESAFYRPKARKAATPPRVHPCGMVLRTDVGAPITAAPIYPDLAPGITETAGTTLGEVARVLLSPWLGTNGVFLLNERDAGHLPSDVLVPAMDTDDVRAGVLQRPTRVAIRTTPDEPPCPAVMAHLERELPRMAMRGRRAGCWWLPPEPFHHIDLGQPSLFVPRIAKHLNPLKLPAGVLPVNHNLCIVPSSKLTLDEVACHLSLPTSQDWVRAVSAPLENGYFAITARTLRRLPVAL